MNDDERMGLPSASTWHRYELCAGSWQLEGEARKIGQVAHGDSTTADELEQELKNREEDAKHS